MSYARQMRSISIQVPRARRVLDFGCGVGWVLAEALIEGTPVRIGVDHTLDAIEGKNGGPQLVDRANSPLAYAVGDGTCLPFADEAFNVVIGHVSMPYLNTEAGLREIYRVLAPGGSFLLTFHSFHFIRKRFRSRGWKGLAVWSYIAVNGMLNHLGLGQSAAWWNSSYFETVNTLHGVARTAAKVGFTLISTEHPMGRIFFAVTARKPNPRSGTLLPAPSWSTYPPLATHS